MAFASKNLNPLITAPTGFTLWHYATADPSSDVDTTGYFNAAAGVVKVGDFILGNCDTGSANPNGIFIVNSNSGGVVDVSNISAFGTLDSD